MDKQTCAAACRAFSSAVRVLDWRQIAVGFALLGLLASCGRPVQAPVSVPEAVHPVAIDTRGAQVYTVNAAASHIHILVYRGGTLARLGHNHIVTSRSIEGRAWVHPSFERSGFELTVPVESLIVDDPREREAHGKDFPAGISQKDIEGTKRNMLRAEVLDAKQFPTIALRTARVSGSVESPVVTARITLKGVTKDVSIPVELAVDAGHLTATGTLDILQTDFGIKPFSIALGALEVQDRLHLEFLIAARAEVVTR